MFLSNNVQFGSLNEILTFIDNVRMEAPKWKFDDLEILDTDGWVTREECFYKIVYACGYKYIPTVEDLDIVWKIIKGCNPIELNRLYYKNNLYNFMDNKKVQGLIHEILSGLDTPYMEPLKPPKKILAPLNKLRDLLMEYVFYCYQIIDRMDRNKNMIKNISVISDTDSSFVSLDAWYHYCLETVKGNDYKILHQSIDVVEFCLKNEKETGQWLDPTYLMKGINFVEMDEWGDPVNEKDIAGITFEEPELDYDFYNDEIVEHQKAIDPCVFIPQDNLKFSIINIMAYVLDGVINAYMLDFTKQSHSYRGDDKCKIIMKNEFYMYRVLLTLVKKHYASLQGIQEGKYLGTEGSLDIKGIDCMAKSVTSADTKKQLKKIMLEDILKPENIDQMKLLKDIAIFEKKIYNDTISGSKKYFKPLSVKSIDNYEKPFQEQGIKATVAWNYIAGPEVPSLDLTDRNGIDVAKVIINLATIEKIKEKHPYQYDRMKELLDPESGVYVEGKLAYEVFKGKITSIAIPKDTPVPEWLLELIDIQSIVCDNDATFPVDSVGISKLDNKNGVTYTNMVTL